MGQYGYLTKFTLIKRPQTQYKNKQVIDLLVRWCNNKQVIDLFSQMLRGLPYARTISYACTRFSHRGQQRLVLLFLFVSVACIASLDVLRVLLDSSHNPWKPMGIQEGLLWSLTYDRRHQLLASNNPLHHLLTQAFQSCFTLRSENISGQFIFICDRYIIGRRRHCLISRRPIPTWNTCQAWKIVITVISVVTVIVFKIFTMIFPIF